MVGYNNWGLFVLWVGDENPPFMNHFELHIVKIISDSFVLGTSLRDTHVHMNIFVFII